MLLTTHFKNKFLLKHIFPNFTIGWFLWYSNASSEIPCKGWHMQSAETMNRTIQCNYPSAWKTLCNCRNIKILIAPCENTQSNLTNAKEKCANLALSSELSFTLRSKASSIPFFKFMPGNLTATKVGKQLQKMTVRKASL